MLTLGSGQSRTWCILPSTSVVYCLEYREKVLVGDAGRRLRELISGVCSERQAEHMEAEIIPDKYICCWK
ncbi:MAG TPA: hypothetical protein DCQ13_01080 [Firmicutes bacterium]|nr:hypothetical protein [Bacillota bacterium]